MTDLQWLDGYSGQTVNELIALEGTHRIDSLLVALEQALDQKAARVGDENLSKEERVILAVEALEREVNNGGYGQFFVNSSRQYVPIIVEALTRIDCPRIANVTQKAIDIVQDATITDEEMECGTWEENVERHKALSDCDSLYFQRPENIDECLFAYVKANRSQIEL